MNDGISFLISAGIMITEYLILLFFWNGLLTIKENKAWRYLVALCFLVTTAYITNVFLENVYLKLFTQISLTFFIANIIFKDKWYIKLFCVALGVVYLKAVDNVIIYLAVYFLNISSQEIFSNVYSFMTLAILSKSIEFIGAFIISKLALIKRSNQPTYWKSWLQTLPFPIVVCFFFSATLQWSFIEPAVTPMLFKWGCILLILCVWQLIIANKLDKQTATEEAKQKLEQLHELQKENLNALTKMYTSQRKLTHEFNNHISVLTNLAHQEKFKDIQNYLSNFETNNRIGNIIIQTKNPVIDVILNHKYNIALENNVNIYFDMLNLEFLPLRNDEIAIVISNLLDNAIEASSKCKSERIIHFKMKICENKLVIVLKNPISTKPIIVNGHLVTTKKDKLNHGFGMLNVEKILNSFNAEYTFACDKSNFSFVAFIPLCQ